MNRRPTDGLGHLGFTGRDAIHCVPADKPPYIDKLIDRQPYWRILYVGAGRPDSGSGLSGGFPYRLRRGLPSTQGFFEFGGNGQDELIFKRSSHELDANGQAFG